MNNDLKKLIDDDLAAMKATGTYKTERVIESKQGREITVNGKKVLNFCANHYLGLSGTDALEHASDDALKKWGYGLASVRFICGTQTVHKELEAAIARFVGTEDAVLYSSCFMANVGLFQTFFTDQDAIISDELNHASIIDAIRLTKSERLVYKHMDMVDLEEKLKTTASKRLRVIATDGVFSMDGHIAPLKEICDLADKYGALVFVDDAHGVGVMGERGRGSHEAAGVIGRVDFLTGTFGKALGGAGGAYTATSARAAEYLRNKSRTYLFSNALDTVITGVSVFVLEYIEKHPEVRTRLWENTTRLRTGMKAAGFAVSDAAHPITPIMFTEDRLAGEMAHALMDEGIYVIGFSYPVVPKGKARIRVQVSAAHTPDDIDRAIAAFTKVGKKFSALPS